MTATRRQLATVVKFPGEPEPPNSPGIIPSLRQSAVDTIASLKNISFGGLRDGEKAGHLDGVVCIFTAPSPANTEFTVYHALGRRPEGHLVFRQDGIGQLTDLAHKWTPEKLVLKSTRANQEYRLLLF